jgi:hypothetical protein
MSESKKQELRILKREVSFQIVLILKKKLFYHATPTKGSILLETQQNSQIMTRSNDQQSIYSNRLK